MFMINWLDKNIYDSLSVVCLFDFKHIEFICFIVDIVKTLTKVEVNGGSLDPVSKKNLFYEVQWLVSFPIISTERNISYPHSIA